MIPWGTRENLREDEFYNRVAEIDNLKSLLNTTFCGLFYVNHSCTASFIRSRRSFSWDENTVFKSAFVKSLS